MNRQSPRRAAASQNQPTRKAAAPLSSPLFPNGSIQCIKLKNFMTFEKATLSPGPGLNLIIGPNGSGKSSIVSAIGICLGASPTTLARTEKVSELIRHQCEESTIKIHLSSSPSFWVSRTIHSDNSSKWRMRQDGCAWRSSTASEVLERVSSLQIQLGNLCMFLPQERVKSFSSLKPDRLLSETEKAISQDTYDRHQSLLKGYEKQKDRSQRLVDLQSNLSRYQSDIDHMKNDVIRFHQIEECEKNIQKYEHRIPWAKYEKERQSLHDISKVLKDSLAEYSAVAKEIEPLISSVKSLESSQKRYEQKSRKARESYDTERRQIAKIGEDRFQSDNKIRNMKTKIEGFAHNAHEIDEKLKGLREALSQIEAKMSESTNTEELMDRKKNLSAQLRNLRISDSDFSTQKQSIEAKSAKKTQKMKDIDARLQKIQNQKSRLINDIRDRMHRNDIYTVYEFVNGHRGTFEGSVFGPICAEVTFNDPNGANILQMVVENHYLLCFLVESESDMGKLLDFVSEKRLDGVTIVRFKEDPSQRPPPPSPSDFGFDKYVSDLFTAPPLVKKFLCNMSSVERIPVGRGDRARDAAQRMRDDLFRERGISRYFIDDIYYIIKRSRHSNDAVVVTTRIRPSSVWREVSHQSEDAKSLREKREHIEGKKAKLDEELGALRQRAQKQSDEIKSITAELQSISDELRARNGYEAKRDQIQKKISESESERQKLPSEEKAAKSKLASLIISKQKMVSAAYDSLRHLLEATSSSDKASMKEEAAASKLNDAQRQLNEERKKHSSLEAKMKEISDQKKHLEEVCSKLKSDAEKYPKEDDNLPDDLEALTTELDRLQARKRSLAHIDPRIAAKYAEAEHKRDEITSDIENLRKDSEEKSSELSAEFSEWREKTEKEISKISCAFACLMETAGYRGEVKLGFEDKEKIESYRLDLMVAFNRQSSLNPLSSTRQSGGEKSVSTLMFLLALQDCTKFPFRVVDEINQGMDEENDKNTLLQVMGYAMRKNRMSQYFLVTPKLLPQIDVMENVTVMVVMNGPFVDASLNKPLTIESCPDNADADDM